MIATKTTDVSVPRHASAADIAVIAAALVLPTVVTWIYFVALDAYPKAAQQAAAVIGKAIQFALPVVWVWLVQRHRPAITRPTSDGLLIGLLFGLAVMSAMLLLFFGWLKPAGLFNAASAEVLDKVRSFGADSVAGYAALALFYSLVHSLLEEYYWRWFVFGQLDRVCSLPLAIGISSVGFSAHHLVVLGKYFGYTSVLTWLFMAGIVIGGAVWAWLYRRSGSLYGPWLSHALVDAAIFLIGWNLLRQATEAAL